MNAQSHFKDWLKSPSLSRKNIETFGMGVRDLRWKKNIKAAHELEAHSSRILEAYDGPIQSLNHDILC